MLNFTETKSFGASLVGLVTLGISYLAGGDGWHLAMLPLLVTSTYCLLFWELAPAASRRIGRWAIWRGRVRLVGNPTQQSNADHSGAFLGR